MKWLLFILTLGIYACSPTHENDYRDIPKNERTNEDAPVPTPGMALRHPGSLRELGLGHAIYMRKCGECHIHKFPDEVRSSQWHIHVPGMAWNAGIEPDEEAALLLYLKAASKDAETER